MPTILADTPSPSSLPTIPGYTALELLASTRRSFLIRSREQSSAAPVLLKTSRSNPTAPRSRLLLQQHYTFLKTLAPTLGGAPDAELLEVDGRLVVIEADDGVTTLRDWASQFPAGQMPLPLFLDMARQIVVALAEIHDAGVIHQNITPLSILVAPEHRRVRFTGFGRATVMPRTVQEIVPIDTLDGLFEYLPPEQSGRMSRGIDRRSDLYSLGAVLYDILVGQPPFRSDDPLEVVHAHLARRPMAPLVIRADLPPLLSDLIMKLLAKEPADRYQTAQGLAADLASFQTEGPGTRLFVLGQADTPHRIAIPDEVVGRDAAIQELVATFHIAARGRNRLVVVDGVAGIGKTALVNQLLGPVTARKGLFVRGKFEQYQLDLPFSGLASALRDLSVWLTRLPEGRFKALQRQLLDALGRNAGVLTQIEPALEQLFGATPPPPTVPGPEMIRRQSTVVRAFFRALCQPDQPLVLFLDDVQWSDANTVRLLSEISDDPGIQSLLVILCMRGAEVPPGHPLSTVLDSLAQSGAALTRLTLGPLAPSATAAMIQHALQGSAPAPEMVELIQRFSDGNPLLIQQALQHLDATGALRADPEQHCWVVPDLAAAHERLRDRDDLVILGGRIARFAEPFQQFLARMAVLGSAFALDDAVLVAELDEAATLAALRACVQEGFLEVVRSIDDDHDHFRFAHDRIQQAAYQLLAEADRARAHHVVGLALRNRTPAAELPNHALTIVGHLNLALDRITGPEERAITADLNRLAATRALAASAYTTAARCASTGLLLLQPDPWATAPSLALGLYDALAEAASLTGDLAAVEQAAGAVWAACENPLDRMRATRALILGYAIQGRLRDAIETCRTGLAWLEVYLPREPSPEQVGAAFAAFVAVLDNRDPLDLLHLPEAHDPRQLAILDLYGTLIAVAYIVSQPLFAWMILTAAERCIRYGKIPHAAFFYGCVGIILMAVTRNIPLVERFGELSLALARQTESRSLRGRAIFVVGSAVAHWSRPLREGVELLLESQRLLLDSGDLEFAGYATYNIAQGLLLDGTPLGELQARLAPLLKDLAELRLVTAWRWTAIVAQLVQTLRQVNGSGPLRLSGAIFDASTELEAIRAAADDTALAIYHINGLLLELLQGAAAEARTHARAARHALHGLAEFPAGATFRFLEACTFLLYPAAAPDADDQAALEEDLRLVEIYATGNPGTFGHRLAIVTALRVAYEGNIPAGLEALEAAITRAVSAGAPHDAALAGEAGARLAQRAGAMAAATSFLEHARRAYTTWGATGRLRALPPRTGQERPTGEAERWATDVPEELDFLALLKASQLLGSKLSLEEIPGTLLALTQERAGATCSALVYQDGDDWLVQTSSAEDSVASLAPQPLGAGLLVPQRLINQVLNTRRDVLVVDPEHEAGLRDDPYIIARRPRSMLCLPLSYGQRALGALYLENTLVSGAFTTGRIDALRILCSQAAIALQNALLFTSLRRSEERFRGMVENNLDIMSIVDVHGRYTFVSPSSAATLGYRPEELIGENALDRIHPEDRPLAMHALAEVLQEFGASRRLEVRFAHSGGRWMTLDVIGKNLLDNPGIRGIVINTRDITVQKEAEAQLRQAQRLEAVGQLTGGVAHDFNNLLTVIIGNLELATAILPEQSPGEDLIRQALRAGERGATLTRSLLAFARQQTLQPTVVDLNHLVRDLAELIRRTIRSDIEMQIRTNADLWPCLADPGQLQNALLNLVVNARDAMPQGGVLTISTVNMLVPIGPLVESTDLLPGAYVGLVVADTGIGMSEAVLARAFEPFFTTKAPGQGSGLGLSMVYGFARQSSGHVKIDSQPGVGTSVHLYLPRAEQASSPERPEPTSAPGTSRQGQVLLVEDEPPVRGVLARMLRSLGYAVLEAAAGQQALELLQMHPVIDLVVTDVILAGGMSGHMLLEEIHALRPDLPALLISGYADADIPQSGRRPRVRFLQKPVNRATLDEAVRAALADWPRR